MPDTSDDPLDLDAIERRWNLESSVVKDEYEKPDLRRVIRECRRLRVEIEQLRVAHEVGTRCLHCRNGIDLGTMHCTSCGDDL